MMLSEGVKTKAYLDRTAGAGRQRKIRHVSRTLPRKGAIVPGADADLIVVDLETARENHQRSFSTR